MKYAMFILPIALSGCYDTGMVYDPSPGGYGSSVVSQIRNPYLNNDSEYQREMRRRIYYPTTIRCHGNTCTY